MSLPSSMADFVPCDRLLQKANCASYFPLGSISSRFGIPVVILKERGLTKRLEIERNFPLANDNFTMYITVNAFFVCLVARYRNDSDGCFCGECRFFLLCVYICGETVLNPNQAEPSTM